MNFTVDKNVEGKQKPGTPIQKKGSMDIRKIARGKNG